MRELDEEREKMGEMAKFFEYIAASTSAVAISEQKGKLLLWQLLHMTGLSSRSKVALCTPQ